MKNILLLPLLLITGHLAIAQQRTTDIWLLDVVQKEGKVSVLNPYRMTDNDHYDNQPCFSKDGKFLYYVSMPDTSQSDLYEFDIRKKIIRQITNTPESEYQPQPIPYAKTKLSYVRVEMEKAQKLWEINIDGSGEDYLTPNEDSVGYYCWINDTTIGAYMLNGPTPMLQQFDMVPQQAIILMQGGFGRCMAKIPGTGLLSYVVLAKEKEGKHSVWQYDMTNEERMPMLELPVGVEDFCWGPDGKVYCGNKGKILMYDTRNEDNPQWVEVADLTENIGNFYRLSMNSTGDKIALVSFKGTRP
jgi:Tol biopolymer transport system component